MSWTELKEYYKDYDKPEREGVRNAEIYCLETRKKEIELTPEQLRELATINEKLIYLMSLRSSASTVRNKNA